MNCETKHLLSTLGGMVARFVVTAAFLYLMSLIHHGSHR